MNHEQFCSVEDKLSKLPLMELDYFRNWLMIHYPVLAMDYDINTIMRTVDGVDADYEAVNNLLENIKDHSKWEIEEENFLKLEKRGYYDTIEAALLFENLSKNEYEKFISILNEKYPIYKKEKIVDKNKIYNSFDENGFPKWIDVLVILKEIKSLNI